MAQILCEVDGAGERIDREAVRAFLGRLRFPLYFLDFETFQEAVPPFDGCWPWEQIPSQYSLHVLDAPGGELRHREFLAPEERAQVREQLLRYCELDTLAMVRIYERLVELSER